MQEDWVAYVVTLTVVALMLLGKKLIFFHDDKNIDKKDK